MYKVNDDFKKIIKAGIKIIKVPYRIAVRLLFYRESEQDEFQDYLSVVAIAKNEERYLREWVKFHKAVGVDRVILFDNNECSESVSNLLHDYIKSGYVIFHHFPGVAQQYSAYQYAVAHYKDQSKYMAFIDIDEFLLSASLNVSLKGQIESILQAAGKNVAGIAVNWRMYGSSGLQDPPVGFGVVDNYLYRAMDSEGIVNGVIKTIANPRRIWKYRDAHYPIYFFPFYSVNEDGRRCEGPFNRTGKPVLKLRINHYFTKSKTEWMERRSRPVADRAEGHRRSTEKLKSDFDKYDQNEVYDPIAKEAFCSIKGHVR